jgi:hypothetical protein
LQLRVGVFRGPVASDEDNQRPADGQRG